MKYRRGLSEAFMNDLERGVLNPLLERVRADTSLDLQIRENYLNIYYRGGSLLKVSPRPRRKSQYVFDFNRKYFAPEKRKTARLEAPEVDSTDSVCGWLSNFGCLKDTMDLWFGKHPKDERSLQQLVVWENNDGPWANGTDYFIVDIEYDSRKGESTKGEGGRFDLVALHWPSDSQTRQLKGKCQPKLAVIEMKAGDGALKGKAGLQDHVEVWERFNASGARRKAFAEEMMTVFQQKQQLGLIRALPGGCSSAKPRRLPAASDLAPEIEYLLLLAGHDPASTKLRMELEAIRTELPIAVCTANFIGFALYQENIHSLSDFMVLHAGQILQPVPSNCALTQGM
jgi:hypothetical protein